MKYLLIIFIFSSFQTTAAECYRSAWEGVSSSGHSYKAYYDEFYADVPLDECHTKASSSISMSVDEYYSLVFTASNDDGVYIPNLEYARLQLLDSEREDLTSIVNTLQDLFEFSSEDFAQITAMFLAAFITGHVLGRIARLFGKT